MAFEPDEIDAQIEKELKEANDPYIIRQLSESIASLIHTDGNIPEGFDGVRVVTNLAVNGETEALRRAAIIEMTSWIRRMLYLNAIFGEIIHGMSEVIGNAASDFPQADEISKKCKVIYQDRMSSTNGANRRIADVVFNQDLSEVLGIRQYVRDQIASFAPGA